MSTSDFTTTLIVDQGPTEVFAAINNPAKWWQGEIKGSTQKLNDEFTYQMETFHFSKQKVVELIPNKKIVWLVTESKLSFTKEQSEWTGTKICFEISEVNNKTEIHLTYLGLNSKVECYTDCSNGWTALIQKSLLSFITKGKGQKVF